jgi:hypothetical protein
VICDDEPSAVSCGGFLAAGAFRYRLEKPSVSNLYILQQVLVVYLEIAMFELPCLDIRYVI